LFDLAEPGVLHTTAESLESGDQQQSDSSAFAESGLDWVANLDRYREDQSDPQQPLDADPGPSELPLPLLLWVDDNPDNVIHTMQFAEELGVCVVSITSTHDAKEWIDMNLDFLRANNTGSRIRVISDNARIESLDPSTPTASPPEETYNFSAGESIIRYLRGNFLTEIPILICCGGSIPYTKYVENYELCGSTCVMSVAEGFVRALKDGRVDDEEWRGWDAGWVEEVVGEEDE